MDEQGGTPVPASGEVDQAFDMGFTRRRQTGSGVRYVIEAEQQVTGPVSEENTPHPVMPFSEQHGDLPQKRQVNMHLVGPKLMFQRADKPVGICGEAAADPLLAVALTGMGITSLSMAGAAVRAVGAQLASVDLDTCRRAAEAVLEASDPLAARDAVRRLLD